MVATMSCQMIAAGHFKQPIHLRRPMRMYVLLVLLQVYLCHPCSVSPLPIQLRATIPWPERRRQTDTRRQERQATITCVSLTLSIRTSMLRERPTPSFPQLQSVTVHSLTCNYHEMNFEFHIMLRDPVDKLIAACKLPLPEKAIALLDKGVDPFAWNH